MHSFGRVTDVAGGHGVATAWGPQPVTEVTGWSRVGRVLFKSDGYFGHGLVTGVGARSGRQPVTEVTGWSRVGRALFKSDGYFGHGLVTGVGALSGQV